MRLVAGEVVAGHRSWITSVAFSPDGDGFVAGDHSGGLVVRERRGRAGHSGFEVTAKVQVAPYGRYSRPAIRSVAWSPDGGYVAVEEGGNLRLRRSVDLAAIASESSGGTAIGIGGNGAWLALLGYRSVRVFELPGLTLRAVHLISPRDEYEYFDVKALGVAPRGPLVAVSDDGGSDETAMGMRLRGGAPQVTLIDVDRGEPVAVIESSRYVNTLVFDPWRACLYSVTFEDIGVWQQDGQLLRRIPLYPRDGSSGGPGTCVATPSGIVTTGTVDGNRRATLDLWEPHGFELSASTQVPTGFPPNWIAAAPDGRTLLTPESIDRNNFGVRVWTVDDATTPGEGG